MQNIDRASYEANIQHDDRVFEDVIGDVTHIALNTLQQIEAERPLIERVWTKICNGFEYIGNLFAEILEKIKQIFRRKL